MPDAERPHLRVRLPRELYEELLALSAANDVSVSRLVEAAVRAYLSRRRGPPGPGQWSFHDQP